MKKYLVAIRALPDKWIDDQTRVEGFPTCVVAANPEFAPIIFREDKWEELDYSDCPIMPVRKNNENNI